MKEKILTEIVTNFLFFFHMRTSLSINQNINKNNHQNTLAIYFNSVHPTCKKRGLSTLLGFLEEVEVGE